MSRRSHEKVASLSTAAKKYEPASCDRLTSGKTAEVLKEIQRHFVIRTSAVIDDETDRLRIAELCRERPGTEVTHNASASIAFQEAVALADRQYAGDLLWDAEMLSSGEAMDRAGRVPACERATVIREQLNRWRELSVEVIRAWAPRFFTIASKFHQQISQAPSQWTKAKLLEGMNRRLRPAQLGAVTFWLRAACGERDKKDVDPSESQTPWRVPAWFVAQQTAPTGVIRGTISRPTGASSVSLTKNPTAVEKICFTDDDGWAVAQPRFSNVALLNTYEQVLQDLLRVKIIVGQRNGNITADALRKRFQDSPLYLAAGSKDWLDFIDDFKPMMSQSEKRRAQTGFKMPTPIHVAMRFLARTTGLKPSTIKKKLSLARKFKKRKKPAKATIVSNR